MTGDVPESLPNGQAAADESSSAGEQSFDSSSQRSPTSKQSSGGGEGSNNSPSGQSLADEKYPQEGESSHSPPLGSSQGNSPDNLPQDPDTPGSPVDPKPSLTFQGSIYTPEASSSIIITGQTLRAGSQAITVSSTLISLAAGGSIAVVGANIQTLLGGAAPTVAPLLTFAGKTYTASSSAFVDDGQTLEEGKQISLYHWQREQPWPSLVAVRKISTRLPSVQGHSSRFRC